MYYVYLLRSKKDSRYYIGYTSDLRRRLTEHNNGQSQFTKNRGPFTLLYYEAYQFEQDARKRELRLKRFSNGFKEVLKRIGKSI